MQIFDQKMIIFKLAFPPLISIYRFAFEKIFQNCHKEQTHYIFSKQLIIQQIYHSAHSNRKILCKTIKT